MRKFVGREDWGAQYGRGPTNIRPASGGVAIHWEGPHLGRFPHAACAGKVRGIERHHVETNGWEGIAYTLVVCPHGAVFEGRGVGHRTAANGTSDSNDRYYAICALAGQRDEITDAMVEGIAAGAAFLRAEDAGPEVQPHSAFYATECPGDRLRAEVEAGTFGGGGDAEPGQAPRWPGVYLRYPPPTTGNAVRIWQQRMRRRGWTLAVDGVYGPASREVCVQFQREKGLQVDGVVGPVTWAAAWNLPIT